MYSVEAAQSKKGPDITLLKRIRILLSSTTIKKCQGLGVKEADRKTAPFALERLGYKER